MKTYKEIKSCSDVFCKPPPLPTKPILKINPANIINAVSTNAVSTNAVSTNAVKKINAVSINAVNNK